MSTTNAIRTIEVTPELMRLIQVAIDHIYAACSQFCTGECDCHEDAQKLRAIFPKTDEDK